MKETTKQKESLSLRFLYRTAVGRLLLKPLIARPLSKLAGKFMSSSLSRPLIRRFVKKNGINLADFHSDSFSSFNDCFTRKIKDGLRPLDPDPNALIAPCDALLSAYRIDPDTRLQIKGSVYSVESLLQDPLLAQRFQGGTCLVFRLCVTHYHRYVYPDSGTKEENVFIKGRLHTVRPIALETYPVFRQNCREYTVLHTDHFGDAVQMEVGAMLVGKIKNHMGKGSFARGEEKGLFLYGGSTIVMLLEKDRALLVNRFFEATARDEEIDVKMGERIGSACAIATNATAAEALAIN